MLKIGHRGAMGYEPENTLRSFKKALDIGVDMVELDVHLCQSGELVVIHDETLEGTTNGSGAVADKTLDELKALDAGQGEQISTLEEVLELIDKKIKVNIELKGLATAEPVVKIINKYIKEKGWANDYFLVSSFIDQELRDFYALNKEIHLGILNSDNIDLSQEINAYSINFAKEKINQDIVKKMHDLGLKVLVYTVNEKDDIKKIIDLKVDGIFSNYPDRI